MLKSNNNSEPVTDDPELWWKLKQKYEKTKDEDTQQQQQEHEHETTELQPSQPIIKRFSFWHHFKIQLYIAIFIFIAFVFIQRLHENKPIAAVAWLEAQLHNQIPFVEISHWYEQTFSGSPSFIPIFENKSQQVWTKETNEPLPLPVPESLVIRSFADSMTGIELSTDKGAEVLSVDEGRVIFVRDEADTVIIQHSNQYVTIYSKLAATNVELNQWVKAGEKIGSMSNVQQKPLLFYAIKKENQYIDPLGVVSFD